MGSKEILLKKKLGQKIGRAENVMSNKLVEEIFWSKKNLVEKESYVEKNIWAKKNSGRKIFCS